MQFTNYQKLQRNAFGILRLCGMEDGIELMDQRIIYVQVAGLVQPNASCKHQLFSTKYLIHFYLFQVYLFNKVLSNQ